MEVSETKRIALIPAYKPDKELIKVAKDLTNSNLTVIVVNDGSGEGYTSVFNEVNEYCKVISYDLNKGKGGALKTGFEYIKDNFDGDYIVVTADADGQHKIDDILKVCDESEKYPDSLVLGSRKFENDVPLRSRFGNAMTRLVYRIFSGVAVHDTQTGLRAFSNKLINRMLEIKGTRYEYEMNMLMELAKEKTEIREVWIKTIYIDEENSSSHFNPLKDSFLIYKEILKFSASSLISFLVDYLLFCIFSVFIPNITVSNVLARICSSIFNFTINKKIVFKSKGNTLKSALKYFLLAAIILAFNTLILNGLTMLHINRFVAKIITEIILFIASYIIQHKFVFRKDNTK